MGLLAENKSRTRINKDPNNTKWTRDTTTFGQKILRAQGWEPGQYLGAQNAAHSELHTAANASYIRVSLKDDMKGLGFNRAKDNEVTGLDVFSDLLSRLNGKSEAAVEDDKLARMAVKTNRYVEAKWGPMRFVRGGLLVGDELKQESESGESSSATPEAESQTVHSEPKKSKKDKKSKKRKAADLDDCASESSSTADTEKKEKRRRKEERRAKKLMDAETGDATASDASLARKKSTKDKSKSKKSSESEEASSDVGERVKEKKSKKNKKSSSDRDDDDNEIESKKSKKEKKEKKEKRRRKEESEAADSDAPMTDAPSSAVVTGTSTPTAGGTGTSTPRNSRNFSRSRFIAQKRQAVLDTKALNQIFMVKT